MTPLLLFVTGPIFAPPPPLPNAETRHRSPEIGLEVKAKAAASPVLSKVLISAGYRFPAVAAAHVQRPFVPEGDRDLVGLDVEAGLALVAWRTP